MSRVQGLPARVDSMQLLCSRLQQHGCQPQQKNGHWTAHCPACGDTDRHLYLEIGNKQPVVLTCQHGCAREAILQSLGLTWGDVCAKRMERQTRKELVCAYDYTDAGGNLLYQVVRFHVVGVETGERVKKDFRQRRPDGKGGWLWKMNGVPRVLYRLRDIMAADPNDWCFACEGEKDCDTLAGLGLVACCNPGGAMKWGKLSDDSALHGRRMCIIADVDAPGRAHAQDVAQRLHGKAAAVKVLELPGEGVKDASDWVEAHDAQDAEDLRQGLLSMAESAPAWQPALEGQQPQSMIARHQPITARELLATYPTLREPVIQSLLRVGEIMNLVSAPKIGKSWLAIDLALAVATGRRWLDHFDTEPGRVLLLDNELHAETLAHRIPKVAEARGLTLGDYGEQVLVDSVRGKSLDLFALEVYLGGVEPGRYRMVLIDAFYRFLPIGIDENSNADVTNLYNHIDMLADRLHCCFVLVHHTSKGIQSGKFVTDVGSGAGAQSRATDTHLILRQHEDENAVVLDAAVRSFAPSEPLVLRWSFPVWQPAPDLDPGQLAEGRRKRKSEAQPGKPEKEVWTAEHFAETFAEREPQTQAVILTDAMSRGLSETKAKMLLRAAEGKRLVHRWKFGRASQDQFATVAQPKGDS